MESKTQRNETTSSDEQNRLIKMIEGNNGMSYQDAVDEVIDNAIDEMGDISRGIIEITANENGEITKIYNNGNPMNQNHRKNVLTLDGRSKKNQKKKKGRFGIGEANSRARLAGYNLQKITSKDGEEVRQVEINLNQLCTGEESRCWTGEHKYRPIWKKIDNQEIIQQYKQGVTKEYIKITEEFKQKFHLKEIMKHLSIKYNQYIKLGLKIKISWGERELMVPDILSDNIWKKEVNIDVYDNATKAYYKVNKKQYVTLLSNKGYVTSKPCKNIKGTEREEIINVCIYATKSFQKTNTNPDSSYAWNHRNNNTLNMFKNISFTENGGVILKCGNDQIEYPSQDELDNDNKNKKRKIHTGIITLRENFIPGIIINFDNFPITYKPFVRKLKNVGDFDSRFNEEMIVVINFPNGSTLLRLQENKDKIDLPLIIERVIQNIIKQVETEYSKLVQTKYEDSGCESKTADKKSENKSKTAEKKTENKSKIPQKVQVKKKPHDGESKTDSNTIKPKEHEKKLDDQSSDKKNLGTQLTKTKKKSLFVHSHYKGPIEITKWEEVYSNFIKKYNKNGLIDCAEIYNLMVRYINTN